LIVIAATALQRPGSLLLIDWRHGFICRLYWTSKRFTRSYFSLQQI